MNLDYLNNIQQYIFQLVFKQLTGGPGGPANPSIPLNPAGPGGPSLPLSPRAPAGPLKEITHGIIFIYEILKDS